MLKVKPVVEPSVINDRQLQPDLAATGIRSASPKSPRGFFGGPYASVYFAAGRISTGRVMVRDLWDE
jgi:hypothetical protein